MTSLKRTSLYDAHVALGGKIVPFAGWELPVQYSGVVQEHKQVRTSAGLFDVSHMGEIIVEGKEAEKALQYLTCNDVSKLIDGKAQYNAILNERGGVVDDIIIYRQSPEKFFICVNASNASKDFEWFSERNSFDASFTNLSAAYGQVALQGPNAPDILELLVPGATSLDYFSFGEYDFDGYKVLVARTGYSGEDGFEIFIPSEKTRELWDALLSKSMGALLPCGLGARDSLRLEACYPLHGHELSETISALESGLGWIVKFDKGDFLGKAALLAERSHGAYRKLVGFFIDEPGIAREGDKIFSLDNQEVGYVTSGTKTPTINMALGMALVKSGHEKVGTELYFEVRGRRLKGHIEKKPFYKKP